MLFFSLIYLQALSQNEPAEDMITDENSDAATSSKVRTVEIINNTRAGIVIFFRSKKRERAIRGQIQVPDTLTQEPYQRPA